MMSNGRWRSVLQGSEERNMSMAGQAANNASECGGSHHM
jgi:predicted secreted protein